MPTKASKKPAPMTPAVRLYMAEDLRQEVNGKTMVIGLYPDNVVVLRLPHNAPNPTKTKPLHIHSLGFLFNISRLSGDTTISVDSESSGKRKPFVVSRTHPYPGTGRSINLVGVMTPCPITHFGERKLIVTVGQVEYTFDYEIRRELIPSVIEPSLVNAEAPKALPVVRKKLPAKRKLTT